MEHHGISVFVCVRNNNNDNNNGVTTKMEKKMESATIEDESSMMTTTMAEGKGRAEKCAKEKKKETHTHHTKTNQRIFQLHIQHTHTHTQIPHNGIYFFIFFIRIEYFPLRAYFWFRVRATAIDLKQQYMIDYNMPCEVFYERQFDVSALRLAGIVRQFGSEMAWRGWRS